jgi:hypothetical protein
LQEAQHETVDSTPSDPVALIQNKVDNNNSHRHSSPLRALLRRSLVSLVTVRLSIVLLILLLVMNLVPSFDAGSLEKYGIGHTPPCVAFAAVNMAYQEESTRICHDWLDHDTNRCDTKKSVLDESVFKYFGTKEGKIDIPPSICIDSEVSSTYYLLEYGAVSRLCYQQLPSAALLY